MVIHPSQVRSIRAEASNALRPAFDLSHDHDAHVWLDRCEKDLAQLWRHGELWAITEVRNGKDGRFLHILAMAGEYSRDLVNEMETWAKSIGCVKSVFTGRKGWMRRVPDYKLKAVTLEKEI